MKNKYNYKFNIEQYAKDCGIYNFQEWKESSKLEPIFNKDFNTFIDEILNNDEAIIGLNIDPDVDGFSSSSELALWLKKKKPNIKITYRMHENKTHKTHEDWINSSITHLIVPDSGSSDEDFPIHNKLT